MKKTCFAPLILTLGMGLMTGCSPALYAGYQDAAKLSCENLSSIEERVACRKQNSMPHDQYEKQRQDLRDNGPEKKTEEKGNANLCFKRESTGQIVCPN